MQTNNNQKPYEYRQNERRTSYTVNPDEAALVRQIYTRVGSQENQGTAIYARSAAGENAALAVDGQEAEARAYCEENGFIVGEVHKEVFSGFKYRERKKRGLMRERYREGKIQGIVIRTLDRLSRSQSHIAILMEEMDHYDITLYSVKEVIDETPMGKFARMVLAFVAEMEREKILDRTITGRLNRAKEGNIVKALGGAKPAYGWKWHINEDGEKDGIVLDEEKADVLRKAAEEFADGVSLDAIIARFKREGILTPGGKTNWDRSALRRMLTDRRLTGKNVSIFVVKDKRSKVHLDSIPVPDGTYPAIISEELYERIIERVAANRAESSRHSSRPEDFLLRAGFVRCSSCGRSMETNMLPTPKGIIFQYVCPNRGTRCKIRALAPLLDQEVWERVSLIADHIPLIEEAIEAAKKVHTVDDDLKATEAAIATCKAQIENYENDLGDPSLRGDTRAGVRNLLNIAYTNLEKLETERAKLVMHSIDEEKQRAEFEKIIDWCKKAKEQREELTYTQKRDFLRMLGACILVKKVKRGTGRVAVAWDIKVRLPQIETIIYRHSASSDWRSGA
jgi:DNA invertase Pin-like site-specific DNA recombinase